MGIALSHLGESLLAQMLSDLSKRGQLAEVRCPVTGISVEADLGENAEYLPDCASLTVKTEGRTYFCDGAQTVDVLGVSEKKGVAFELKLGFSRMGFSEFKKRFCYDCSISRHKIPRINGSMVALLDRRIDFPIEEISAILTDQSVVLERSWWLVIREHVWLAWQGQLPVRNARILIFDELATIYGNQTQFDDLVRRVVGSDFAAAWNLRL